MRFRKEKHTIQWSGDSLQMEKAVVWSLVSPQSFVQCVPTLLGKPALVISKVMAKIPEKILLLAKVCLPYMHSVVTVVYTQSESVSQAQKDQKLQGFSPNVIKINKRSTRKMTMS